jgi:hypothetical protein
MGVLYTFGDLPGQQGVQFWWPARSAVHTSVWPARSPNVPTLAYIVANA